MAPERGWSRPDGGGGAERGAGVYVFSSASSTFNVFPMNSVLLNQLTAADAADGSSNVTVPSPFGSFVALSL